MNLMKSVSQQTIYTLYLLLFQGTTNVPGEGLLIRRSDIQQSAFHAATAQYTEVERALLTVNDIFAMPKLVGMLFGVGLARRCQAARMPKGEKPQLVAAPRAPEVVRQTKANANPTVNAKAQDGVPEVQARQTTSQTAINPADQPNGNLT